MDRLNQRNLETLLAKEVAKVIIREKAKTNITTGDEFITRLKFDNSVVRIKPGETSGLFPDQDTQEVSINAPITKEQRFAAIPPIFTPDLKEQVKGLTLRIVNGFLWAKDKLKRWFRWRHERNGKGYFELPGRSPDSAEEPTPRDIMDELYDEFEPPTTQHDF